MPSLCWRRDNLGYKPNDALFHAEATNLLRIARAFGGSLRGKSVKIVVDRDFCSGCEIVLPRLAEVLGNPEVTVVDPNGVVGTIKNGAWVE